MWPCCAPMSSPACPAPDYLGHNRQPAASEKRFRHPCIMHAMHGRHAHFQRHPVVQALPSDIQQMRPPSLITHACKRHNGVMWDRCRPSCSKRTPAVLSASPGMSRSLTRHLGLTINTMKQLSLIFALHLCLQVQPLTLFAGGKSTLALGSNRRKRAPGRLPEAAKPCSTTCRQRTRHIKRAPPQSRPESAQFATQERHDIIM